MNLDMTLREVFELADRMAAAAQTIRDAQAALGGAPDMRWTAPGHIPAEVHADPSLSRAPVVATDTGFKVSGVLRSTPQPSSASVDPPEGLIARGKTGVEIIAERQREEIARRTGIVLDPKLGLVDAEAMAVKERLRANREQAGRDALAKMTDEQRKEFGA